MFRLIKLAAFALLGYALYELYLGMTEGTEAHPAGEPSGGRMAGRERQGAGTMTGPGEGTVTETAEPGGMSTPHTVGRGVVPQ